MTIGRGKEWGSPVERPGDLMVAASDAELVSLVGSHPRPNALAVAGGDLHRSLGAPGLRERMQRVDVDLVHVTADGRQLVAVAHVVARRRWWRGPIVVVANVDHLGEWNIAPRAHPNDGRLDVLEVDPAMTLRQRWQARQRLPQGTHVPHPRITTRSVAERSWRFERPLALWIDGQRHGEVSELSVRVESDAFRLLI